MNKIILTFSAIAIFTQIGDSNSQKLRITNGEEGRIGDVKCYTLLTINFPESDITRRCGGCLIANNKVLSAASCVTTPFDGNTTRVSLSHGNFQFTRLGYGVSKVAHPATYDYTNRKSLNDIAVLTLNRTVNYNPILQKSTPSQNSTPDAYVGQQLFVCGFGDINNRGNRPATLKCTYLTVVPSSECLSLLPTTAAAGTTAALTTAAATTAAATTAAATSTDAPTSTAVPTTTVAGTTAASSSTGIICTRNSDDSNACRGDNGSPVFSNATGTLELVGVVSFFPDSKSNAPCQDGHRVIVTQVGSFTSFITANLI